jgi:cytochrome c oxidase subunit 3
MSAIKKHRFHLVERSPWPILSSIAAFGFTISLVAMFHSYNLGGWAFLSSTVLLILLMGVWWKDVVHEGTFAGYHTKQVQKGLRIGVILFIVSEVMFFFSFFWGFFHSSLAPTITIGNYWPPVGIDPFNPLEIPLLNTATLLLSGVTVTWAHHALRAGDHEEVVKGLFLTIILGLFFTLLQFFEYLEAPFAMDSGIYGSVFFLLTGFHGMHVIIGTIFLVVCCIRAYLRHFTTNHHVGFEAAAWYWHFVDVVWLFVYIFIYWWGGHLGQTVHLSLVGEEDSGIVMNYLQNEFKFKISK